MRLKGTILAIALAGAVALPAAAETLLTKKNSGERLREPQMTTVWLGDGKIREDQGKRSFIADLAENKIYVIRHDDKVYHEFDYPIDFKKIAPPDVHQFLDQLQAQMAMDVQISKSDERKQVNGYATTAYDVKISSPMGIDLKLRLWVTDELPFDVDNFKRLRMAIASANPSSGEMVEKVMTIPGFPVLTETSTRYQDQEISTTEELVSVETKEAPDGTFLPPSDYNLEPFDYTQVLPMGAG